MGWELVLLGFPKNSLSTLFVVGVLAGSYWAGLLTPCRAGPPSVLGWRPTPGTSWRAGPARTWRRAGKAKVSGFWAHL